MSFKLQPLSIRIARIALSGAILFFCFFCHGCSSYRVQKARQELALQAQDAGFQPVLFHTSTFLLKGLWKNRRSKGLRVYIEGDGLAWFDAHHISEDPTPSDPLGFQLAAVDCSTKDVLYLARPCQFVRNDKCRDFYWTYGRFHPDVLMAYQEVLNQLNVQNGYSSFTLLGYSGGAAVALLIAAQRHDVHEVITFAGTLDHHAWTSFHDFTALFGSLNPPSYAAKLQSIPQTHFIGMNDHVMPVAVANSYLHALRSREKITLVQTPLNHYEGWRRFWQHHPLNHESRSITPLSFNNR
jgi:hypothetical protein